MRKKKILILCYNNVASDPRVQRQITALINEYQVEVCATGDSGIAHIPYYPIYKEPSFSLIRKLKRATYFFFRDYERFYWDDYKKYLRELLCLNDYDIIIANDIQTLPLAISIANKRSKVYFDSHDYHPREFDADLKWKIFHQPYIEFLCKKYIPKASAFSTSSQSIANEYEQYLKVRPSVITNAAYYIKLTPSITQSEKIKLVHHGAAIPGRKIETMINAMRYLEKEKYCLYLILTGQGSRYYNRIRLHASEFKNVCVLNPVPFNQIIPFINTYDIGLYCLAPTHFNNRILLPNKIFEYIQARLCIVVSPTHEMAQLVQNYNLGIVSEDFSSEALAKAIKKLTVEKIMYHKKQADLHAKELSAEKNIQTIREIVKKLISE
jgi:glycosyltransferase involved in cell wall biosynthesis